MFLVLCFLFLLPGALAVYDHRPAERFQSLMTLLSDSQLAELKSIVYDQSRSKGRILRDVKSWVGSQPPSTQFNFVRSQLEFRRKDDGRNRALDAIESHVSAEARLLNRTIRRIYDDPDISDRQTCESVSVTIATSDPSVRNELDIEPMDCAAVFAALAH